MYNKVNVQRHQETRKCINCGKEWTIWVQGYDKVKQHHFCHECLKSLSINERRRIRKQNDLQHREKVNAQKREFYKKHIIHYLWFRAKQRAEKYKLDFNIEESDIIIPEICPLLEIPIKLGSKDNYESTPSLDRIDNTKGYVKDNIWVISKKANSMKNSASFKELACFCKNILRYSLSSRECKPTEQENKESLG